MKRHNKGFMLLKGFALTVLAVIIGVGLPFWLTSGFTGPVIVPTAPDNQGFLPDAVPEQKPGIETQVPAQTTTKKAFTTKSRVPITGNGGGNSEDVPKPAPLVSDEQVKQAKENAVQLAKTADELYSVHGKGLTADLVRKEANISGDYHFIITIGVKSGSVTAVSYFTADYSVRYSDGGYSPLANVADDSFEDSVLFL